MRGYLDRLLKTIAYRLARRVKLEDMKKKKAPWSRNDKIGAVAAVLVLLGIVVGLFVPEVRRKLRLEKAAPASVAPAPAQVSKSELPAVAASKAQTPSVVPPAAKPKIKQHGTGNVAAGSIVGNCNVVQGGSHNQASPNCGPVVYRPISDKDLETFSNSLSIRPGKVRFETRNASNDTLNYAATLRSAFNGKWTTTGGDTVAPPDIGDDGKPLKIPTGIVIYPSNGKDSLAKFLQKQLGAIGVKSRIASDQPVEPFRDEDIEVFVGEPD